MVFKATFFEDLNLFYYFYIKYHAKLFDNFKKLPESIYMVYSFFTLIFFQETFIPPPS